MNCTNHSSQRCHKKFRYRFLDVGFFGHKKSPKVLQLGAIKKMLATTYSPAFCYAVPSALKGLTSVFGMGTGISPSLLSPAKKCNSYQWRFVSKKYRTLRFSMCGYDQNLCIFSLFRSVLCEQGTEKVIKPNDLLVPLSSIHCYTYTCGLSTR